MWWDILADCYQLPWELPSRKEKYVFISRTDVFVLLLDLSCSCLQHPLWSRDCPLPHHISDCGVDGPHSSQEPTS